MWQDGHERDVDEALRKRYETQIVSVEMCPMEDLDLVRRRRPPAPL